MPEVIDWDAFEKWEKIRGRPIPPGVVNLTQDRLSVKHFRKHFKRRADLFCQEGYLLLVPTEDESARSLGKGSIWVRRFMETHLDIKPGHYPAQWVENQGLLVDLKRKGEGKIGLAEVLGSG